MATAGFSLNYFYITEGNSGITFAQPRIELSAASQTPVTVHYTTTARSNGNATPGVDYSAATSSVTFAPGETSKAISLAVLGDTTYETSENFYVDITSADGATVVVNGAEGLRNSWVSIGITNDDTAPTLTAGFPLNYLYLNEGNSGITSAQPRIELSAASQTPVTVHYTTTARSNGNATPGVDYSATTSSVTFAPGETSKAISLAVLGDTTYETSENFYVDITSADGATVVVNGAEGLRNSWVSIGITNDDILITPTLRMVEIVSTTGVLALIYSDSILTDQSLSMRFTYNANTVYFNDITFPGSASVSTRSSVSGAIGTVSISAFSTPPTSTDKPIAALSFSGRGEGIFDINFSNLSINGNNYQYNKPPPLQFSPTTALNRGSSYFGSSGADPLNGTEGMDTLRGGAGNDAIDGGLGIDFSIYLGEKSDYLLRRSGDSLSVEDRIADRDGLDSLKSVERIVFSDVTLALDFDGIAGKAYRLYQAAYDRIPDRSGLGWWIYHLDSGFDFIAAANNFLNSAEFRAIYGADPSNEEFVRLLYQHVNHRDPDSGGNQFWLDAMGNKDGAFGHFFTRGEILLAFSESAENKANLIGVMASGFEYIPFSA